MSQHADDILLIPHRITANIYLRELGRAYTAHGKRVVFGPENLYESELVAGTIHLHWPENIYRGYGDGTLEDRIALLIERLDVHKRRGARLVWTVHNLIPHDFPDSQADADAYQAVIDRADLLVHHCNCSIGELAERYRVPTSVKQIVTPHGHYLAHTNDVSRAAARQSLGIPDNANVLLLFGALRGYKGLENVFAAFRQASLPHKYLLVAGKYENEPGLRGRIDGWRLSLRHLVSRKCHMHLDRIEEDRMQYFLNAADAMVLGHQAGLNSGVAVLAMSFGLPVIGPRIGCLPEVLEAGANLLYERNDVAGFARCIEQVPSLDQADAHRRNRAAVAEWDWNTIAGNLLSTLANTHAA